MITRATAAVLLTAFFFAPMLFEGQTASAQQEESWSLPRTAWGHPDLQGIWSNSTTTPLERPADLADKEFLSQEEWAARNPDSGLSTFAQTDFMPTGAYNDFWLEKGELSLRTSLLIDPPNGRLPPPTAAEQARRQARRDARADGSLDSWEDFGNYDRCISRGMPGAMMPGFYNHNYHIVQTPDHVAILVEMIHDARVIPFTPTAETPSSIRQWLGTSRARWDGDTLVVETTNLRGADQLHVVERLTRTGPDAIDYRMTVTDPALTAPWTALIPMHAIEGPLFEYACHEGNYALPNMLRGARADEQQSVP